MSTNTKFFNAYKNLETELRYDNKSVLDYENTLVGVEQEKLKACRIMRNYLAHNDTTFLTTSNAQIKFLENLTKNIKEKSLLVKHKMKKIPLSPDTSWLKAYIKPVDNYKMIPIQTKNGIFLLDVNFLIHSIALNHTKLKLPRRIPKYLYTKPDERISNLQKSIYIVTDNGLEDGKYLGVLFN